MKKLVLIAALATAMTTATNAASISGSTDFKVTVPEILVLYHWDEAHLTLTANAGDPANDSDLNIENSDTAAHDLSKEFGATGTYEITGDVSTALGTYTDDYKVNVKLVNSWAVRAISSGDVELAVSEQSGSYTLKNVTENSSTIALTDVVLTSSAATSGSNTAALKLAPQWRPQMGNIEFEMDLSNITRQGDYTSSGTATATEDTDTFLLTLTGN